MFYNQWNVLVVEFTCLETFTQPLCVLCCEHWMYRWGTATSKTKETISMKSHVYKAPGTWEQIRAFYWPTHRCSVATFHQLNLQGYDGRKCPGNSSEPENGGAQRTLSCYCIGGRGPSEYPAFVASSYCSEMTKRKKEKSFLRGPNGHWMAWLSRAVLRAMKYILLCDPVHMCYIYMSEIKCLWNIYP